MVEQGPGKIKVVAVFRFEIDIPAIEQQLVDRIRYRQKLIHAGHVYT